MRFREQAVSAGAGARSHQADGKEHRAERARSLRTGVERMMRHLFLSLAAAVLLAGGATAQTIHPPTKEGAGAKPDSAEAKRERIPEPPGANRPEARGGAESQQNRDYGKETQPEGKNLHEGLPATSKP